MNELKYQNLVDHTARWDDGVFVLTVVTPCGRLTDAERIHFDSMSYEEKTVDVNYYSDISRAEGVRQIRSSIV